MASSGGGLHVFGNKNRPGQPIWWSAEEPVPLDRLSDLPSTTTLDNFSFQSNQTSMGGTFSELNTPDKNKKVIIVPARGSETPLTRAKLPGIQGSSTPEVQFKLSKAPVDNVKEVAMRMYRSMKQHGLATEAERAFKHLNEVNKVNPEGKDSPDDELVGMDFILKDGILSYLREVARIIPPIPQQVVRFMDITYTAKVVVVEDDGYETFGKKLLGCLLGPLLHLKKKKKTIVDHEILKDVIGYVMPGSMTLLLGPPGCGKSSMLKILAGRAELSKKTVLEGSIMYNDREASEVLLTRVIAYINGQLNMHIPFLTVRETIDFAEECTQGLSPEKFSPQMRKFFAHALVEDQDPFVEYVLQVLSLKNIEHHLVGAGQEGITDNERARLTAAEIAVGTYSLLLYDQTFSGQDPLATYDLVHTLRAISRIQQCSAVMSLIQLSEEVFNLFDRVILLSEGQIIYQGPRQDVLHHFSKLGYKKPVDVDTGDFLQDIASGEGMQYMEPDRAALDLEELVKAYKLSDNYKDILRIVYSEDVLHTFWVESEPSLGLSIRTVRSDDHAGDYKHRDDQPRGVEVVVASLSSKVDYSRGIDSTGRIQIGDVVTGISCNGEELKYIAVGTEDDQQKAANRVYAMLKNARGHVQLQVQRSREEPEEFIPEEQQYSRPFVQSWWASTKTLIKRQKKIAKRLKILILLRLIQVMILGIFAGTLFYQKAGQYDAFDINIIRAMGFVSNMSIMLINIVQLPVYMLQRPILYKQRSQRFFRASSYVIAHMAINIPQSLAEATLYAFCLYFLTGLSKGHHFFEFWCLLFLVCYFGSTFVLLLSAIAPIIEAANALSGLFLSMFLLFSGFVIFPSSIPGFWKWVYYVNPLHWANLIFCITQIGDTYQEPCEKFNNSLPFCQVHPNLSVGKAFLKQQQLQSDHKSLWLAYSILVTWVVVVNVLCVVAINKIQFPEVKQSLPRPKKKTPILNLEDEGLEYVSSISWNGFPMNISISDANGSDAGDGERTSHENSKQLRKIYAGNYDEELASVDEVGGGRWRSSNIPVKPLTLSFDNLIFSAIDSRTREKRQVLDRVSGYAKPGSMVAFIGSSKSGKTTLLKILAGRAPPGTLEGEILANGFKVNLPAYLRIIGFAEKLDAHQPFLTVRESLHFSAALRLADNITAYERVMHVDLILELLELFSVCNQLIGSLRNPAGITYEIAKKITIAVELAANPSILFLDEPTAELNSVGIRSIMNALQTIAATGRTVISTIRHPNARLLGAFTNVLILSTGGQQVYFGPVGLGCRELLNYFVSIPKVPQYLEGQNPITFVLDVLGAGIHKREPVQSFDSVYRSSSLAGRNTDELRKLRKQNRRNALKPVASAYVAPYWQQAGLVFLRTQRFLWRNTQYTFGRLVAAIALGLLLGSVYIRIKVDESFALTARALYIYMQLLLIGAVVANNVIPQIGSDRLAYYREKRAQMYAPLFYPISWAIAEIPYLFLAALAYVGIGNSMVDIAVDSASSFFTYLMSVFMFTLCITYLGMLLTIATPQPMLAAFAVSIVTSIWVTSSGVVVPFLRIGFYGWLFWSNPYQYVLNTLTSIGFYCDTAAPACSACRPGPTPCPACRCDRLMDLNGTFAWSRIEYTRSLRHGGIPTDFAAVSAMTLLFALLAFLSFAFLRHNARPAN